MSGTEDRPGGLGLTWKVFAATAVVVVAVLALALVITAAVAQLAPRSESARPGRWRTPARWPPVHRGGEDKLARGAAAAAQFSPSIAAIVNGDPGTVLDQASRLPARSSARPTRSSPTATACSARGPTGRAHRRHARRAAHRAGARGRADERRRGAGGPAAVPRRRDAAQGPGQRRRAGVLLAAHQVTDTLAREVQRATGSEVVFYVLDGRLAAGRGGQQPRFLGPVLDARCAAAVRPVTPAPSEADARRRSRWGGERLVGFERPARQPRRRCSAIGGYLVLRSHDAELAAFRRLQRTLLVLAMLVGLGARAGGGGGWWRARSGGRCGRSWP